MSLYADEDLGQPSSASSYIQASSSTAAAPSTLDPVNAFATAASLPAESPEQAAAFTVASERFEQHPERLPELCASLLQMTAEGGESLLRSWSLDMVALAVGRSSLQVDVKSTSGFASLTWRIELISSCTAKSGCIEQAVTYWRCINHQSCHSYFLDHPRDPLPYFVSIPHTVLLFRESVQLIHW